MMPLSMIKPTIFILISGFLFSAYLPDEEKPAYLLYNEEGMVISYSELLEQALDSDLIFFGELHNNAIAHWLQHELARDLAEDTTRSTKIGMEMFEADQQILIDEYFDGHISQNSFENEARLWENYRTDYRPIVEFARKNGLNLVATNIPRRYASAVSNGGPDVLKELSRASRQWLVPLPFEVDKELPGYKYIARAAHGHGGGYLVYAQAVKDATMAHFILLNMEVNDRMIHLNGSYHSNNREGIVWYINEAVSGYEILTINTIVAEDVNEVDPEQLQAADVTLVVPSRMTTTF
jgi:uncharacterized iron-regulated protein